MAVIGVLGLPSRSNKSAELEETHPAATLQRTLNERRVLADLPDAVWHDAEDVFAELDADNVR